jgi:hypothetical protein
MSCLVLFMIIFSLFLNISKNKCKIIIRIKATYNVKKQHMIIKAYLKRCIGS